MSAQFSCDACGAETAKRPTEPIANFSFPVDGGFEASVRIALTEVGSERWPDLCAECRDRLTNEARAFVAQREALNA